MLCCKIAVAYARNFLTDCGNAILLLIKKFGKYGKWCVTALYFAVVLGVCVRIIKFIGGV